MFCIDIDIYFDHGPVLFYYSYFWT